MRSPVSCCCWRLLAAARTRNAVRWSEWIAGGVFAILTATIAAIMRLFDGAADPNYVIQATGIGLCMLGAGIFLPFDAPRMLALGSIALALHVGFTFDFPLAQNFPVLISTLSAVVIATVGARELTRSRRAEFEGRCAKEDLVHARSDFVAMLTHDIKNPLSVIDGFVEMIRDDAGMSSGVREELLSHVQTSVRTAITLAVNFLDASKIEADRFILRTRLIDIGDLVRGVLSDQRPSAQQKGVQLLHDSAADASARRRRRGRARPGARESRRQCHQAHPGRRNRAGRGSSVSVGSGRDHRRGHR